MKKSNLRKQIDRLQSMQTKKFANWVKQTDETSRYVVIVSRKGKVRYVVPS